MEAEELLLRSNLVDDIDSYSIHQLREIIGVTQLQLDQSEETCELLKQHKKELSILAGELAYNPSPSKADLGIG